MSNVPTLLTPEESTLIFIDHQPQMLFGVANIERQSLINNVVGLAKSANIFDVPTILTTVETKSFSGYMWPQLLREFPGNEPIERTSMNSWEDEKFVGEVKRIGSWPHAQAAATDSFFHRQQISCSSFHRLAYGVRNHAQIHPPRCGMATQVKEREYAS